MSDKYSFKKDELIKQLEDFLVHEKKTHIQLLIRQRIINRMIIGDKSNAMGAAQNEIKALIDANEKTMDMIFEELEEARK